MTVHDLEIAGAPQPVTAAGEAERIRRANTAYQAIQDYRQNRNQRHLKAALDPIRSYSSYASSDCRLIRVIRLIEFTPPKIFWPALMDAWCMSDATWNYRARVLWNMKNARKPALAYFSPEQRQFFETLSPLVLVFRGCSRVRVCGIAWTVDREIAEGFARGHRGIKVPEPVIASALVPKEHIFFVTDDRQEKEIVLNPRRLRRVVKEPFNGA
jgi:hypothetical protein